MVRRLSILLVALVLVAAGCGGGNDEASSEPTATVTETTDTTDTGATTEESTTETSDSGTDFNWASEDCQNLVKAYVGLSAAIAAASGGQDVSGDVEEFSQYVDKVPDEIREDVETIAAAYGSFLDELAGIGWKPGEVPTADQIQALETASQSVGTPEVQAAGERLNAWTTENCT